MTDHALIYVGIDDTDMPETPGTNQLARALVELVSAEFRCRYILRHQLFFDPRVPYTSKNGSASIWLESLTAGPTNLPKLIAALRARMLQWFVPGSDPGLCVTMDVPAEVTEFGLLCKRDVVTRRDAELLASRHGLHLEGLGGTCGGMIGALAAVGLAATRNDGRVVVNGDWSEDVCGEQSIERLTERDVDVRCLATGEAVRAGRIDVGKHLRPNLRDGRVVLFAEATPSADVAWKAVRLT